MGFILFERESLEAPVNIEVKMIQDQSDFPNLEGLICPKPKYKNGIFKWLEQKLEAKFPELGIKVRQHIESIIRSSKTESGNI